MCGESECHLCGESQCNVCDEIQCIVCGESQVMFFGIVLSVLLCIAIICTRQFDSHALAKHSLSVMRTEAPDS